jgi:uncharacterized protein YbjT (DUF2867 family)
VGFMTDRGKILVTGATGKVGGELVPLLLAEGADVRALARDPSKIPAGAEGTPGDLSALDGVASALNGVDAVFLLWPFATADGVSGFLDLAEHHARHVVFLSSMNVPDDPEEPAPIFHSEIERLIARTGLSWTFLRAGGFAGNTLEWAPQIREEGVVRWPFAGAARSLIHEHDIAAVAARALLEDVHQGAKYALTGPEAITQEDQVHAIGEAIGRPVRWAEIPPGVARERLLAQGWDPGFADSALTYWASLVDNPEPVTSTVEDVTGKPARTFAEWAIDHAHDFAPEH